MTAESLSSVDGRRARRDQNRDRVVDALLDIYRDGVLQPSVAEVAQRSGVSHRSVFRYFEDLDELYRVAVERQYRAVAHHLLISGIGGGPVGERIDEIVESRMQVYDAASPVTRVGHMLAPVEPVLSDHLRSMAALSVDQVQQHFAPELTAMDPDERGPVAEAASIMLTMDAIEVLRHIRGLSRDQATSAMRAALRGLFAERSDP